MLSFQMKFLATYWKLHNSSRIYRMLTVNLSHNPPTIEEIKKTLISLKNGKASTDVPPEFLNYSVNSEEMLNEIHKIFCDIWETFDIPTNWTHSKLVCLWKGASKGNPTNPKTYRELQIGTIMCKFL